MRWCRIGYWVMHKSDAYHEKVEEAFGDGTVEALFSPLLSLDKLFYGACVFADEVIGKRRQIAKWQRRHKDYFERYDNKDALDLDIREYAFFCCCGRIYRELKLVADHVTRHAHEIKEIADMLEPLKNIRDGYEHRLDDYWEEVTQDTSKWTDPKKRKKALNWLRRGGLPKITGMVRYVADFELNRQIVREAYSKFASLVLR